MIKLATEYLASHCDEFGLDPAAPLPALKDPHRGFFRVDDAPPDYPYVPMAPIVSFEGQKYRGVDVLDTQIMIGVDPFKKMVVPKESSGRYYGSLSLAVQPTADFGAAIAGIVGTTVYGPSCLGSCDVSFVIAKEDVAKIKNPDRLVIIPPGKARSRLAWEVDVYVGGGGRQERVDFFRGDGTRGSEVRPAGAHFKVYIDANTGTLIEAIAQWMS